MHYSEVMSPLVEANVYECIFSDAVRKIVLNNGLKLHKILCLKTPTVDIDVVSKTTYVAYSDKHNVFIYEYVTSKCAQSEDAEIALFLSLNTMFASVTKGDFNHNYIVTMSTFVKPPMEYNKNVNSDLIALFHRRQVPEWMCQVDDEYCVHELVDEISTFVWEKKKIHPMGSSKCGQNYTNTLLNVLALVVPNNDNLIHYDIDERGNGTVENMSVFRNTQDEIVVHCKFAKEVPKAGIGFMQDVGHTGIYYYTKDDTVIINKITIYGIPKEKIKLLPQITCKLLPEKLRYARAVDRVNNTNNARTSYLTRFLDQCSALLNATADMLEQDEAFKERKELKVMDFMLNGEKPRVTN